MPKEADSETNPTISYYKKWAHHDVGTLIRMCDDFIVHVTKDGKLEWETGPEVDSNFKALAASKQKQLNYVFSDIVVCEAAPIDDFPPEQKLQYQIILGEAYVHWMTHDPITTMKLVKAARNYYQERSKEISRKWYLSTTGAVAGTLIILGLLAWIFRDYFVSAVGSAGFHMILAGAAGAIGALFSVIARSGQIHVKSSAGIELHILEACSRVCLGVISGIIAYLALSSDILLTTIFKAPHREKIIFLFAIAAGAGERLATSIISQFDSSTKKSRQKTSEDEEDHEKTASREVPLQ